MIAKNCDGKLPISGALSGDDEALLGAAGALLAGVRAEMDRQQFHNALTKVWEVVGDANRYIDHAAPWTLRKTDPARMATVLYVLAEAIRRLAILCQPVMPDAMAKMLDQLAVDPAARAFTTLESRLVPGTALPAPQPIFPRSVEAEAATAKEGIGRPPYLVRPCAGGTAHSPLPHTRLSSRHLLPGPIVVSHAVCHPGQASLRVRAGIQGQAFER